MARFIKTISADGSSAGGSAGVSLSEVCTAVCKVVCDNATRNANGITETAFTTPQIIPGFGEWEIICNCPCWDDCYGCQVVWCFPATKPYSAYRIYYKGMAVCACCYMNFQMGLGTEHCFCCCSSAYCMACLCAWPARSCCVWARGQCCVMTRESCFMCCNSGNWSIVDIDVCVYPQSWVGSEACGKHNTIGYDVRWQKYQGSGYQSWEFNGNNKARQTGTAICHCMVWGTEQNSSNCRQFTRLCFCTQYSPFQSTLNAGTYIAFGGGNLAAGTPCWTIYGKPCNRPCFGTISGSMA